MQCIGKPEIVTNLNRSDASLKLSYDLSIKPFDQLTKLEVLNILQARMAVFVVEQNCAYQDIDGFDENSFHLILTSENTIAAYARIIPTANALHGESNCCPTIGRVLVLPQFRAQGLARMLLKHAIAYCHDNFQSLPIFISAQTYLTNFYESLGFTSHGSSYSLDDIEHINMYLHDNSD